MSIGFVDSFIAIDDSWCLLTWQRQEHATTHESNLINSQSKPIGRVRVAAAWIRREDRQVPSQGPNVARRVLAPSLRSIADCIALNG
jgi:hypothetical protein